MSLEDGITRDSVGEGTPSTHSLEVRLARPDEVDTVLAFYHEMIDVMVGTDFDILWKYDEHPSNDFIRTSVQNGYAFVGIADDGNMACGCVIDHDPAPGYECAPWEVNADAHEIGIVHSVATLPQYHRRGYAEALMREAIEKCRAQGMKSLQLDTFTTNDRAHGLYRKLGFREVGPQEVFYEDLGHVTLDMFEYVF